MNLNKIHAIAIVFFLCLLMSACESYNSVEINKVKTEKQKEINSRKTVRLVEKITKRKIKKHTAVYKLDDYQFQYQLKFVENDIMDSLGRALGSITDTFTVQNIYKGKGLYEIVLYSHKRNKRYELYSIKNKHLSCGKIKVGNAYSMTIVPYFREKKKSRPIEIVKIIYLNGYMIIPYPLFFGQVYSTNNLDGLYYISPNGKRTE